MSVFLNDHQICFTEYPNGETAIPLLLLHSPREFGVPRVRLHWENDQDITRLVLLRGYLSQLQPDPLGLTAPALTIDYMPYSRMDREQDRHCFSLKHIAKVIVDMGWSRIDVVEPHSQVTLDLLGDKAHPIWATTRLLPKAMEWIGFNKDTDFLVLPDKGAADRYRDQAPEIIDSCHLVVMGKDRDFETGQIKGLKVDHTVIRGRGLTVTNGQALILDDLSSRGGTFCGAADILRGGGVTKVNLLVTHMEPAGLLGDLRHKLDRVFCTDTMTFRRPVPRNFTVFQREDWA